MMYAGKLVLSPKACRRLGVTDRYSFHRLIMDLTGESADGDRILWADDGEHLEGRVLRLFSTKNLCAVKVPDDLGFAAQEVPESFFAHGLYRFAITVNPTVREAGKIRAVRDVAAVRHWLEKKMAENGMTVDIDSIRSPKVVKFVKKECKVIFFEVKAEGVLHVEDEAKFRKAVADGIGRSKAFGCGLLQLALCH